MQSTELDGTGIEVSAIGLGAMPLSLRGRPSEQDAIAVIHRALDLGVTFIDTADSYCIDSTEMHHHERLIDRALHSYDASTSRVSIATKGGLIRPEGRWVTDCNPARLRTSLRESFEALGGDRPIDLWQLHAPDKKYEIDELLEPAVDAVEQGLIRHIGVSNFSVTQIEEAREVADIVSVQNQWNPWYRNPEFDGVLDYCDDNNLTFIPWSPFGGSGRAKKIGEIDILTEVGERHDASPYCATLAWMMGKSDRVLPIPGASRKASIEDSVRAADLQLTDRELAEIDEELPSP